MNIGITCYPTVGGSGAVAAELGKQLAKRGHTIHFVSYRLPFRLGEFQQNVSFHEVDVSSYVLFEYPPHDLALAAKMAECARDHRLDLFHVHYAIPHAIAGLLAQQMLGPQAPKLRNGFRIVEGRLFTPGKFEVIVGQGAAAEFRQLKVGSTIRWGTTDWTVAGIFGDNGSVAEAEIWTDAAVLQGSIIFVRNVVSYLRGEVYDPANFVNPSVVKR